MSLFFAYLSVTAALLSALMALSCNQRLILSPLVDKLLARWPNKQQQVQVGLSAENYADSYRLLLFLLLGLSGVFALLAGAGVLISGSTSQDILPMGLPWLHWHLRIDPLSGFFLCVLGLPLIAISLYGPGYTKEYQQYILPEF